MAALISFVQAHAVALSALAVAVIDFLIAMNPAWESNGIIHLLLSLLQPKAPPAA